MNRLVGEEYYLSHKLEIIAQFVTHAKAWEPYLVKQYGNKFSYAILRETRRQYEDLISKIPYIGGDDNTMTRHLVRSTTSLMLYKALKARGKTSQEVGEIVYKAVDASVSRLNAFDDFKLSAEFIVQEKEQARKSQERCYPGDWVWEFVEGDGLEFHYGYDFLECATQKLYRAYNADEFLPFYCYLDFVTHRTTGWGFARTKTLAEGFDRCNFRWKRGGETKKGWPPSFVK